MTDTQSIRVSTLLALSLASIAAMGCSSGSPEETASVSSEIRLECAPHGGAPLEAFMTGEQEVPGPGDPDGFGYALLSFNAGQEEICFEIEVENLDAVTAAHIHAGEAGVAGPIVVGLNLDDPSCHKKKNKAFCGCVYADRDLITEIHQNAEDYYVNVHTEAFPAGAVRGQLGWP